MKASRKLECWDSCSESTLQRHISTYCRMQGWVAVRSRMDCPTTIQRGVCDFIIFADRGRVFLLECKSKTGRLTEDQKRFAEDMARLGHKVHLVRDFYEALDIFNSK